MSEPPHAAAAPEARSGPARAPPPGVRFTDTVDAASLKNVIALVERDLSEPYSCFTYRYFVHGFVRVVGRARPPRD